MRTQIEAFVNCVEGKDCAQEKESECRIEEKNVMVVLLVIKCNRAGLVGHVACTVEMRCSYFCLKISRG